MFGAEVSLNACVSDVLLIHKLALLRKLIHILIYHKLMLHEQIVSLSHRMMLPPPHLTIRTIIIVLVFLCPWSSSKWITFLLHPTREQFLCCAKPRADWQILKPDFKARWTDNCWTDNCSPGRFTYLCRGVLNICLSSFAAATPQFMLHLT